MLYANYRIQIEPRQTPEGNFNGAVMGQFTSGSRRFYLDAPRKVGRFIKGDRPDLSLAPGHSRPDSHVWRIAKVGRPTTHLILSSRQYDDHGGTVGAILAPVGQPVTLVDYATSGVVSYSAWQIVLLQASPGDLFAIEVRPHTKKPAQGVQPSLQFYLVGHRKVTESTKEDLAKNYEALLAELDRICVRHATVDVERDWQDIIAPPRTLF